MLGKWMINWSRNCWADYRPHPPYVHIASTWCYSHDECSQAFAIFRCSFTSAYVLLSTHTEIQKWNRPRNNATHYLFCHSIAWEMLVYVGIVILFTFASLHASAMFLELMSQPRMSNNAYNMWVHSVAYNMWVHSVAYFSHRTHSYSYSTHIACVTQPACATHAVYVTQLAYCVCVTQLAYVLHMLCYTTCMLLLLYTTW